MDESNYRILFNVFVWYASSVVCTNSSKTIAPFISPLHLTLLQLCFATAISYMLLKVFKIAPFENLDTPRRRKLLLLLGLCFAAGFTTFNMSLHLMHVSLSLHLIHAT
jgi:drug/metabolite transporter (DMT)-like permease